MTDVQEEILKCWAYYLCWHTFVTILNRQRGFAVFVRSSIVLVTLALHFTAPPDLLQVLKITLR